MKALVAGLLVITLVAIKNNLVYGNHNQSNNDNQSNNHNQSNNANQSNMKSSPMCCNQIELLNHSIIMECLNNLTTPNLTKFNKDCILATCIIKGHNLNRGNMTDRSKVDAFFPKKIANNQPNSTEVWLPLYATVSATCFDYIEKNRINLSHLIGDPLGLNFNSNFNTTDNNTNQLDQCNVEFFTTSYCFRMEIERKCPDSAKHSSDNCKEKYELLANTPNTNRSITEAIIKFANDISN